MCRLLTYKFIGLGDLRQDLVAALVEVAFAVFCPEHFVWIVAVMKVKVC